MNLFLEPVTGKGLKIPVDKAIIFIGRHPDCDVVITRSRMISRKHCAIVQINDTLVIRDLGSTNGVRVNGQRVRKEQRFAHGDRLTIGDIDYVVKGTRSSEPERRDNRNHPQDARAAGASPPRVTPAHGIESPFSREVPVAIPEDEEFEPESTEGDTPDSFPVVQERKRADAKGPARSERPLPTLPAGETPLPLPD